MSYIPRQLGKQLSELIDDRSDYRNVILVEGARQTGKSTLISHAVKSRSRQVHSINLEESPGERRSIDACEDFTDFQQFLEDRHGLEVDRGDILYIDEAQESESLGGFVRFMKENWPDTTVILTGSSLQRLFRKTKRYPVGRVSTLVLGPFSFQEYLEGLGDKRLAASLAEPQLISSSRHSILTERYEQFLASGGLPEAVKAAYEDRDSRKIRQQIYDDLERDFLRLFSEEESDYARLTLRAISQRVGSPFKFSSIITSATNRQIELLRKVINRLEAWHIVLHSEQSGPTPESSHRFHPKKYLFDTGLLRDFREQSIPPIKLIESLPSAERSPLGGILENQTAVDLKSQATAVSGWKQSSSGNEIDFTVKLGESILPIECKAAVAMKKNYIKGLLKYMERFDLRQGIVLSLAPYEILEIGPRKIVALPYYCLSSGIQQYLEAEH